MDLRNFKEKNAGCIHELKILSGAPGLSRVAVLTNEHTELAAAQAAATGAPAGRFTWVKVADGEKLEPETVLAALFDQNPKLV
jgi:hypothetical protein